MQIKTDRGQTFDINFIMQNTRQGKSVMIEIDDVYTFSQIAEAFEGVESLTKTDEKKPGVTEKYEGYTELLTISRDNADGVIRFILKRP